MDSVGPCLDLSSEAAIAMDIVDKMHVGRPGHTDSRSPYHQANKLAIQQGQVHAWSDGPCRQERRGGPVRPRAKRGPLSSKDNGELRAALCAAPETLAEENAPIRSTLVFRFRSSQLSDPTHIASIAWRLCCLYRSRSRTSSALNAANWLTCRRNLFRLKRCNPSFPSSD
jgi:hypothetical protein